MSEAQRLQKQITTYFGETIGGIRQRPIGCYTVLLVFALVALIFLHLVLVTLVPGLDIFFLILFSWVLAGLSVCLLLYLWLKFRAIAVVVTLITLILCVTGLARYVQSGEFVSYALAAILALGIPVLLVSWFLRLSSGLFAGLLSFMWLLLWSLLAVGLREYQAGVVLLLSLVASSAVFLPGLYIVSGFLLPLREKDQQGQVFDFLRGYTMGINFPAYVVVDELHEEDKVEKRVPGDPFSFLAIGQGFVLSDCDHAVAISDGVQFKGVQGPGVVFIGFADRATRTIDLRPQLSAFHVEALTKDGIKIRVLTFVPFKIDARGRRPRLGEPLPYNKGAAFRAVHAQKIEHEGKGQIPERMKHRGWDDLPRLIAERILQNIISTYNFDELYGPYQPGGEPPRRVIAQTLREQLAAKLEPLGIQLVGGGISDLEPADPKVYVERVRSWQADWTRKIMLRQAEGQAERLRIVERARAETRADLILSLGRQLEELSVARTELRPETVLNQFLTVLEELTMQPMLRRLLPRNTRQAMGDIRKAISE